MKFILKPRNFGYDKRHVYFMCSRIARVTMSCDKGLTQPSDNNNNNNNNNNNSLTVKSMHSAQYI